MTQSTDAHTTDSLFAQTHDLFIGVDSDGCVFDNMELKHKECFCPNFIRHFGLQAVSKYARQVWEFVNLYSTTRGCNRFIAVWRAIELLAERPETASRHVSLPDVSTLKRWTQTETKLGEPVLQAFAATIDDPVVHTALAWTRGVNQSVAAMVHQLQPFPFSQVCLQSMAEAADVMVVSQASADALGREWTGAGLRPLVRCIAGQEFGTKAQQLVAGLGGRYAPGKAMMVGDAPGDRAAASAAGAAFYPINPGDEEASWQRLRDEALPRFLAGTYTGEYEQARIAEFQRHLPERAPWQNA